MLRRLMFALIISAAAGALTFDAASAISPPVDALRAEPMAIRPPLDAKAYSTYRGPNTGSRVVLTYDDCPRSVGSFKDTINYATNHNIGLVLFPTGQCILNYKKNGFNMVKYARDRGHWMANHSYSHPNLTTLSFAKIVDQIDGTAVSNYGRPPYGAVNDRVRSAYASIDNYNRNGMHIWLWTVDTNDWRGKTRSQVVNYVVKEASSGDTVLMHMQWRGFSPTALKEIKSGLSDRNLGLCRVWRGSDKAGNVVATGRVIPSNPC